MKGFTVCVWVSPLRRLPPWSNLFALIVLGGVNRRLTKNAPPSAGSGGMKEHLWQAPLMGHRCATLGRLPSRPAETEET
uniref:Uncharacterized protein n=1 Tax=Magallana gigas TaxID=29159 RepID=K1PTB6_MAGGI